MSHPNVRLQPRDLAWMTDLAEVGGILDLPTIAERHFPGRSIRRAQQRMKLIADLGIVDRLVLTVTSANGHQGRLQHFFRLNRRGAEIWEHETGRTLAQRPAKRPPRPETIQHRLGVAKLQLSVNDACALHGLAKPAWIHEHDTYPDLLLRLDQARKEKKPLPAAERFILVERFPLLDGRAATFRPDASCLLHVPRPDGTTHPLILYWEYDRSTIQLSEIAGKMFGIEAMLRNDAFAGHWPQAGSDVRIFFVVPSEARLKNIAAAIKTFEAAKLVRLTTVSELKAEHFFHKVPDATGNLQGIWRTVDAEARPIVEHPLIKQAKAS